MHDNSEVANLVRRAKKGDSAAMQELYQNNYPRMVGAIKRIVKNPDVAADLASDAWLKAMIHLKTYKGEAQFSTWVYRIGVNEALMHVRKRDTRDTLSFDALSFDDGESMVDGIADLSYIDKQQQMAPEFAELYKALDELPPRYRNTVIKHYFEGYTMPELAKLWGRNLYAMKTEVSRGVARLRNIILN